MQADSVAAELDILSLVLTASVETKVVLIL